MNQSQRKVFGQSINDPVAIGLVNRYCDGAASPAELAELEALVLRSPEVRDYLIAHSLLISQLVSTSSVEEMSLEEDESEGFIESSSGKREYVPSRGNVRAGTFLPTWGQSLAIAASLCLFLWGGAVFMAISRQPPEALGVLRHVSSNSPSGRLDLITFINGSTKLDLDEGQYELSLRNGVDLTVAGPARLDVESLGVCRLSSGRITAVVPKTAEGFKILAGQAEIIDHGTRFGVAITPDGSTDVAVFEGEIEIHSGDQHRNLMMGRAVSIARDGEISRMSVVKPDTFQVAKRMLSSLGPAIISVRDNIRATGEMKYYRIVHEGFGEDQPAYVDRVHQWNGVDDRGLPKELIGADYVMTFNDDRVFNDIVISVDLARPSDVYVLLDERVTPPHWLSHDYVDTGLKVGMDEGERPGRPEDPRTLGVGVGNSIDYHFHVWKRKTPAEGTVDFGGLPQMTDYRSMYGILAVPLPRPLGADEAT